MGMGIWCSRHVFGNDPCNPWSIASNKDMPTRSWLVIWGYQHLFGWWLKLRTLLAIVAALVLVAVAIVAVVAAVEAVVTVAVGAVLVLLVVDSSAVPCST